MVHSFYVYRHGVATSVDNKTSPKKNEAAHGNPPGESVDSPVGPKNTNRSGSVPAGG